VTDEIVKAMQYKKMIEAWQQRLKERNCLLDEKLKHDADREAALKVAPKKPYYDAMLRWKMTDQTQMGQALTSSNFFGSNTKMLRSHQVLSSQKKKSNRHRSWPSLRQHSARHPPST
jgi:spermidine synthase